MYRKLFLLVFLIFLSGCTAQEDSSTSENEVQQKDDYIVDVKQISGFESKSYIEKSGRLDPLDKVSIVPDVNGKVESILVKEGDFVSKGQTVVNLSDNTGNYKTSLEQARNELEEAKIKYNEQKEKLTNAVNNAKNNMKTKRTEYNSLKEDVKYRMDQLDLDIKATDLDSKNSPAFLELQKLKEDLEKLKVNFQNQKRKNRQKKEEFLLKLQNNYDKFKTILKDVTYEGDKLLGVTDENKNFNNSFDNFLGAKNTSKKIEAENKLEDLIKIKNNFPSINENNTNKDYVIGKLNDLSVYYNNLDKFLDLVDKVLKDSITGSDFTQKELNNYLDIFNGFNSENQQFYDGFLQFKQQVKDFYENYKQEEKETKKEINSLKTQIESKKASSERSESELDIKYQREIIDMDKQLNKAKIALEKAKNNYESAKKEKQLTLKSLQNSIEKAEISYNDALDDFNKLNIKSPISGVVDNIDVEEGEKIKQGDPIGGVGNRKGQEIDFSVSNNEVDFLNEGKSVKIIGDNNTFAGNIYSISKLADQNLKYNVKVRTNQNISKLGNYVDIKIPTEENIVKLPLSVVNNIDGNKGFIYTYNNGELKKKKVKIGKISGSEVEILTEIDDSTNIITTSMQNFNKNQFNIKLNK